MIKQKCMQCQKEFLARKSDVNRGRAKFCSRSCGLAHRGVLFRESVKPNTVCSYCGIEFYKHNSDKISKSGLYFCCRKHKDAAQKIGGVKEIMPSHYGSDKEYRRIAFSNKPIKCERCGYDEHPAGIVVHHKDHNRSNNKIENLEVLCAICHNIEHWGS